MKWMNWTAAAMAALFFALPAQAEVMAGTHYSVLQPPQPTGDATKVEVTEFFSYGCKACGAFDPYVGAWEKKLPKDVVFKRVHVSFNHEDWKVLARMYYALEAMGVADKLHTQIFDALYGSHKANLGSPEGQSEWLAAKGVDKAKYLEMLNSFTVNQRMTKADTMSRTYKVPATPALAVDGKFLANNKAATSYEGLLKITDELIAKARAEKAKK